MLNDSAQEIEEIESRLYSQVFHVNSEDAFLPVESISLLPTSTGSALNEMPRKTTYRPIRYFRSRPNVPKSSNETFVRSLPFEQEHGRHLNVASNTCDNRCQVPQILVNPVNNILVLPSNPNVIVSTMREDNYNAFDHFNSHSRKQRKKQRQKQKKNRTSSSDSINSRQPVNLDKVKMDNSNHKMSSEKNNHIIYLSDSDDNESCFIIPEKVPVISLSDSEGENKISVVQLEQTGNLQNDLPITPELHVAKQIKNFNPCDDDIIFVESIIDQNEVVDLDDTVHEKLTEALNEESTLGEVNLQATVDNSSKSGTEYLPGERRELLSTPESSASNEFLDHSNIENHFRFNFSLHGSDFRDGDFLKPAKPVNVSETGSSCSTSDISSILKPTVFNEVEFPKHKDLFEGANLESFRNSITPKRKKDKGTKNDDTLLSYIENVEIGLGNPLTTYEKTKRKKSSKKTLPDLSPMCSRVEDSQSKKQRMEVEHSEAVSDQISRNEHLENHKSKKKKKSTLTEISSEFISENNASVSSDCDRTKKKKKKSKRHSKEINHEAFNDNEVDDFQYESITNEMEDVESVSFSTTPRKSSRLSKRKKLSESELSINEPPEECDSGKVLKKKKSKKNKSRDGSETGITVEQEEPENCPHTITKKKKKSKSSVTGSTAEEMEESRDSSETGIMVEQEEPESCPHTITKKKKKAKSSVTEFTAEEMEDRRDSSEIRIMVEQEEAENCPHTITKKKKKSKSSVMESTAEEMEESPESSETGTMVEQEEPENCPHTITKKKKKSKSSVTESTAEEMEEGRDSSETGTMVEQEEPENCPQTITKKKEKSKSSVTESTVEEMEESRDGSETGITVEQEEPENCPHTITKKKKKSKSSVTESTAEEMEEEPTKLKRSRKSKDKLLVPLETISVEKVKVKKNKSKSKEKICDLSVENQEQVIEQQFGESLEKDTSRKKKSRSKTSISEYSDTSTIELPKLSKKKRNSRNLMDSTDNVGSEDQNVAFEEYNEEHVKKKKKKHKTHDSNNVDVDDVEKSGEIEREVLRKSIVASTRMFLDIPNQEVPALSDRNISQEDRLALENVSVNSDEIPTKKKRKRKKKYANEVETTAIEEMTETYEEPESSYEAGAVLKDLPRKSVELEAPVSTNVSVNVVPSEVVNQNSESTDSSRVCKNTVNVKVEMIIEPVVENISVPILAVSNVTVLPENGQPPSSVKLEKCLNSTLVKKENETENGITSKTVQDKIVPEDTTTSSSINAGSAPPTPVIKREVPSELNQVREGATVSPNQVSSDVAIETELPVVNRSASVEEESLDVRETRPESGHSGDDLILSLPLTSIEIAKHDVQQHVAEPSSTGIVGPSKIDKVMVKRERETVTITMDPNALEALLERPVSENSQAILERRTTASLQTKLLPMGNSNSVTSSNVSIVTASVTADTPCVKVEVHEALQSTMENVVIASTSPSDVAITSNTNGEYTPITQYIFNGKSENNQQFISPLDLQLTCTDFEKVEVELMEPLIVGADQTVAPGDSNTCQDIQENIEIKREDPASKCNNPPGQVPENIAEIITIIPESGDGNSPKLVEMYKMSENSGDPSDVICREPLNEHMSRDRTFSDSVEVIASDTVCIDLTELDVENNDVVSVCSSHNDDRVEAISIASSKASEENDDVASVNSTESGNTHISTTGVEKDLVLANCQIGDKGTAPAVATGNSGTANQPNLDKFDVDTIKKGMSDDPNLWKIIDRDRSVSLTIRGRRCNRCREIGHIAMRCPKKNVLICSLCGNPGHLEPRCPSKMCMQCGRPGDYSTNYCRECAHFKNIKCILCKVKGHGYEHCPDLWRRYHLTTLDGPLVELAGPNLKKKERHWCCACASSGHLDHECNYDFKKFPPCKPNIVSYAEVYNAVLNPHDNNSTTDPNIQQNRSILLQNLNRVIRDSFADNRKDAQNSCSNNIQTNLETAPETQSAEVSSRRSDRQAGDNSSYSNLRFDNFIPLSTTTNVQAGMPGSSGQGKVKMNSNANGSECERRPKNVGILDTNVDDSKKVRLPKFNNKQLCDLFLNRCTHEIKEFVHRELTELRNFTCSPRRILFKFHGVELELSRKDSSMSKSSDKVKCFYKQLNMLLFGKEMFKAGNVHFNKLCRFMDMDNISDNLSTTFRKSLMFSHHYLFSEEKQPNCNYAHFLKLLTRKYGRNHI